MLLFKIFFNNTFYLFLYVCKQTLHLSQVRISQKVSTVIMGNLCETYVKMKILVDFHTCISVPYNDVKYGRWIGSKNQDRMLFLSETWRLIW